MTARLVRLVDGDDQEFSVVVQGLAPDAYDALLAEHTSPGARYDAGTFPVHLITRCLKVPDGIRLRDVEEWADSWPLDQWDVLLTACIEASGQASGWPAQKARLDGDALFALEMDVCRDYGIPHSVFLSWGPVDRDKAIAHLAWQRDRCPGCGIRSDLVQDRDAADVVGRPCVHCEALTARENSVPADRRKRGGVHFSVVPR